MSGIVPRPDVIGFAHRGARAHARENTIEAFTTACRMGADALETDVWLSRDGRVIIDHDGVVRRGWRRIPIARIDAAELPQHLPTLDELQQVIEPTVRLSIDVKDGDAAAAIIAVRARLGRDALRRTWLCHRDPERVAHWRSLDPDVKLVASFRRRHLRRFPFTRLADAGIQVVNLPHAQWSKSLIDQCHQGGLDAFAWGIQNPSRMRELVSWGIDAIYSDHTDRMVAALGISSAALQPTDAIERPDLHERPTDDL